MAEVALFPTVPKRTPSGWPIRPVGGSEVCSEIADWLFISKEERPLPYMSYSRDGYRWIFAVSKWLLEDLHASEKSLHLRAERDRLNEILAACKILRSKTAAYTGTQGHLEQVVSDCGFFSAVRTGSELLFKQVQASDIVDKPLEALSSIVTKALNDLETLASLGRDRDTIFEKVYGNPRRTLAVRCALWLIGARGLKGAPPTVGGPVEELMSRIWRHATGTDAPLGFDRLAKEGARLARTEAGQAMMRRDGKWAKKLSMQP